VKRTAESIDSLAIIVHRPLKRTVVWSLIDPSTEVPHLYLRLPLDSTAMDTFAITAAGFLGDSHSAVSAPGRITTAGRLQNRPASQGSALSPKTESMSVGQAKLDQPRRNHGSCDLAERRRCAQGY